MAATKRSGIITKKTLIYVDKLTTRKYSRRKPVGFGIACGVGESHFLSLLDHKKPFVSEEQAMQAKIVIENARMCREDHRIVQVYESYEEIPIDWFTSKGP